jgi:hypothetical protein
MDSHSLSLVLLVLASFISLGHTYVYLIPHYSVYFLSNTSFVLYIRSSAPLNIPLKAMFMLCSLGKCCESPCARNLHLDAVHILGLQNGMNDSCSELVAFTPPSQVIRFFMDFFTPFVSKF